MMEMFEGAESFNRDIGGWNTAKVTKMFDMFEGASTFNGDIGGWNVGNVYGMQCMFCDAVAFNRDIGDWNIGNVNNMIWMFNGAEAFNQDIGDWNTGNVTYMNGMFAGAWAFNQDIGDWNTSNVGYMASMFEEAEAFNQDIGDWNTSKVTDMSYMFYGATAFDQDLGAWQVGRVQWMDDMLTDAALSVKNYDSLLNGWAALPSLETYVDFAATTFYTQAAASSRQKLEDEWDWSIADEGLIGFTVAPNAVKFGDQQAGMTSDPKAVTVTNAGTVALSIPAEAFTFTGTDPGQFAVSADSCSSTTVVPEATCTVTVRFSPATPGTKTAALYFASSAPDSPQSVALTGTGVTAPTPAPTVTLPPPPPTPAAQKVKKPPARLKKGRTARLAKESRQGAPVTWQSRTKRNCTVKKHMVKALKPGTCLLKATAPKLPGYKPYRKNFAITVR